MVGGRPKTKLMLSDAERAQLDSIARSRSMPAKLTVRAQIVLAATAGETNKAIARQQHLSEAMVGKWRRRFLERRIFGLYDQLRPGRPRIIEDDRTAALIRKTQQKNLKGELIRWSMRSVAVASGISKSSIHRYLQRVAGKAAGSKRCTYVATIDY